jgi:hypothetical protein
MDTAESHAGRDARPEQSEEQDVEGRRRIGEIFVELGFVSSPQLEAALDVQREKGGRIGEILVEQGSLTRLDLASALAEHWEPHRFALPRAGRGSGGAAADTRRLAEQDQAVLAELEERLRSAEERLGSVEGSASRGSFMARKKTVAELQERLVHVEQLVGSLAALNLRLATLEQALEQIEGLRQSDAVATGARLASSEAALEKRLEWVESRNDVIATLEEAFDALGLRLRALEASAAASATELADRLTAREEEASGLREALEALRRDVDAGRAVAERASSSLKLEAGSLAARIDELRGLRSADSQELRRTTEQLSSRLDDLARRLDAQEASHEENVVATERMLLEELTAFREMLEALEAKKARKKEKPKKGGKRKHDASGPELD